MILKTEHKDLSERREKLLNAIETANLNYLKSLSDRLSSLEKRITEIDMIIKSQCPSSPIHYTISDIPLLKHKFKEAYCNDTYSPEKSAFIGSVIRRIIVGREKISVDFHDGILITNEIKKYLYS